MGALGGVVAAEVGLLPSGFTQGLPPLSFTSRTLRVRHGEGWRGSSGSWSSQPRTIRLNKPPSLEGWGWSVADPQGARDPGGEEDACSGFAALCLPLVRDVPGYPASQLGPQPIPRAWFSCSLQILRMEGAGVWDQQFLPTRQPLSHGKT